ncbi:hypothetical protein GCM10027422_28530 [Hymenobacter arcticus]
MHLPFDLVGGLVVVRNLTINGQQGDFVLDTGCAYGLVVEQAAFAGHLHPSPTRGLGATGSVAQQQLAVTGFQFGAAHYTGFTAVAISLAAIRPTVGPKLLGLLGYELLRAYEVVVDYPHKRLSCYPLHPARRIPFERRDSLAFTMVLGKPIAKGYIGKTPVQLLLDTGAMSNNLDTKFSQALAPAVRPRVLGPDRVIGSSSQQAAQRAILSELQLPPTAWQGLPMVLAPFAQPSNGRVLPYQGILGFPFLSQDGIVSFHYGRRQFYSLAPKSR